MTNYLSDKIRLVSFLLIILVLYIHSGFHENEIEGMYWNNLIQDFISGKMGRLAVPLFFMISGYLYFRNTYRGVSTVIKKMKSRVKTILLPYLISCVFFVLFLVLLQIIPGVSNYMNGNITLLFGKPIVDILQNIFWVSDGGNSPLAFQLWFLRDLIAIVAISPFLYYIFRILQWWSIPLIFGLSLVHIIEPASLFSSLFWFSIGSVISLTKISIEFNIGKWSNIILLLYIILSVWELILGDRYFIHFQKPIVLIGIIGVWLTYDSLVSKQFILKESKCLSLCCGFTFFIYLFHEPTINIVRKLIVILIGKTQIGYSASYLLSPFIFILLAVLIGICLKKISPKIYSSLVGGRV